MSCNYYYVPTQKIINDGEFINCSDIDTPSMRFYAISREYGLLAAEFEHHSDINKDGCMKINMPECYKYIEFPFPPIVLGCIVGCETYKADAILLTYNRIVKTEKDKPEILFPIEKLK